MALGELWWLDDPAADCAAASLVVSGLGSDAGIVDLDGTLEVLRRHAPSEAVRRIFGPMA
jgi:hypothetical protein